MKKKLMAIILAGCMVFGQAITAFASDIGLPGEGQATGTSPSEFEVADELGGGATVRLPANLDLTFTEELDSYQVTANVGVYGDVKDYAEIAVSIDEDLIYSDGVAPEGTVSAFSLALPTLETGDEDYPYYYRLKSLRSGNTGSDSTFGMLDVTFKSKTPLYYAKKTTNTNTGDSYGLYCYKDGNYAEITNFYSNSTSSYANYNISVSTNGSKATSITANGSVVCVSGTLTNVSGSTNETYSIVDMATTNTSNHNAFSIQATDYSVVADNSSSVVAKAKKAFCTNYGYTSFAFSGLVFDSPNAGKAYYDFNDEDCNHVTGHVRFGENVNGICTEVWNAEECAVGYYLDEFDQKQIDLDAIDNRLIMVNVPSYEVYNTGTYYATAEFDIVFTCVGQTSDISAQTKLSGKEIVVDDYSYSWDEDYTSTAKRINLGKLSGKAFALPTAALDSNDSYQNIKYLQLADNATTNYLTYIDDTDPANCKSWITGLKGLQVLVIPANVTTEQLHMTAGNTTTIDSNTEFEDNNSVTAVFDETSKKIGNAMCFVKTVDANNKFIYVPHICYRGTKDEFKALSGYDNWVFGNAGNIVTVHCTDGIMYY